MSEDTEVIVTLSVEKARQKIEVTIPVKGNIIRAEQACDDMYVSIDLVEEVIERQMRRYKTRLVNQQHAAGNFQKAFLDMEPEEEGTVKIVRNETFCNETRWMLRKRAFRWNSSDIISLFSEMRIPMRSMLFIRETVILTD